MSSSAGVTIPLRSGESIVVDELPDDATEMVELLSEETPKLDVWLRVANLYYKTRRVGQAVKLLEAVTDDRLIGSTSTRSQYRGSEAQYRRHSATAFAALATARVEALGLSQRVKGLAHVHEQAHTVFRELQVLQSRTEAALGLAEGEADDSSRTPSQLAAIQAAMSRLQLLTVTAQGALVTTAQERRGLRDQQRSRAREVSTHCATQQSAARLEFASRALASSPGIAATLTGRKGAVSGPGGFDIEGFSIPACLGEADAALRSGDYARGRQLFARAIRAAPRVCPASARVGLGICLYRLGHTRVAVKAMERAIQLDKDLAVALSGFAVLQMAEAASYTPTRDARGELSGPTKDEVEAQARARARVLLARAVELEPREPTALLALAQLAFWSWEQVKGRPQDATEDVPVLARVVQRSRLVWCSAPVAHLLRPGQVLRVGEHTVFLASGTARHDVLPGEPGMEGCAPGTVLRLAAAFSGATAADLPVQRRTIERSGRLAHAAAEASTDLALRAEARYLCGKANHVRGNMLDAYVEYKRCSDADPSHVPAIFGKAQFMISQNRPEDARKLAQTVLERQADNADALRLLCHIDRAEGRITSAAELALRATEVAPTDYDAWLQRAEIAQVQRTRPMLRDAMKAYRRAGQHMASAVSATHFELLCNIGALKHSLGDRESLAFYQAALRLAAAEAAPDRADNDAALAGLAERVMLVPKCATLAFNLALLHETTGETHDACHIYEAMLRRYPGYSDAALRLGVVASKLGDGEKARAWFTRAVEAARGGAQGENALAALGRQMEEEGDFGDARARFSSVIGSRAPRQAPGSKAQAGRAEPYSELAKANIYFGEIYRDPRASHTAKSPARRDAAMKRAFEGYKSVLKLVPGNVYAANGLGMILAEQGRVEQARTAFRAAREAMLEAEPVAINLAHTELALGNGGTAVQLYRRVLRQFKGTPERRVRVLLFLARACSETQRLTEARRALQEALVLQPDNLTLWFNLAYVMGIEGLDTLNETANRTLVQVEHAVRLLQSCVRRLKWLNTIVENRESVLREADAAKAQAKAAEAAGGSAPASDSSQAELLERGARLRRQAAMDGVTAEQVASVLTRAARNLALAPQHLQFQRRKEERKRRDARKREERRNALLAEKEQIAEAARVVEREQRRVAEEAARALQSRVAELNRVASERRAQAEAMKRKRSSRADADGVEYDVDDLTPKQLDAIARGRRAGDEDDDIKDDIDPVEELRRAFAVATEALFADAPEAAGDAAAAAAPAEEMPLLTMGSLFGGVPELPDVAPDAKVGGGFAGEHSEAADQLVAQLGIQGEGDGADSDSDSDSDASFGGDAGAARSPASPAARSAPRGRGSGRGAARSGSSGSGPTSSSSSSSASSSTATAAAATAAGAAAAAPKKRLVRMSNESESDSESDADVDQAAAAREPASAPAPPPSAAPAAPKDAGLGLFDGESDADSVGEPEMAAAAAAAAAAGVGV
ncbi:hypothetical protein FNF29_00134 [Cafeteria roenbergensis]|uniref:Uncharacterized protein n=1 Tax=Cafeteria roenbergensis TaxID=33653 RepID=A0A5A8CXR2_CAFRO|nr:hypothetical protein FNF29_00134 [Cafeteria roenbergensis]|eukprot:KAA0157558.1 hypothetical protein FNF29_00134 [Cafeteria roenbergensis]